MGRLYNLGICVLALLGLSIPPSWLVPILPLLAVVRMRTSLYHGSVSARMCIQILLCRPVSICSTRVPHAHVHVCMLSFVWLVDKLIRNFGTWEGSVPVGATGAGVQRLAHFRGCVLHPMHYAEKQDRE